MAKRRPGRVAAMDLLTLGALVLLSPVLFLVGYRIAAKRLLTGPALRAEINQKPEEIWIDWDEAVSTWPGRVSVKNLRIRGSDPNVQWIVILPEATLRYSLMPLLRGTSSSRELRPTSIQFRLRQKLVPGKFTEEQAKQLPPIPGFSDPPLRAEGREASGTPVQSVHFRGAGRRHGRLRRHLGGLFPLPRSLQAARPLPAEAR